jgi:APA family basic amino acid/polyamine antiporter
MSAVIATLLVATISGMVLAGSRVTQAVASALPRLGWIAARTGRGVPRNAVLVQAGLTAALLLTNSFERVMAYAGFTLNLMTLLTVVGLFRLRRREPDLPRPFRVWGYPVVPALFVLLSVWTLGFVLRERPAEALAGLVTLASGLVVYRLARRGGTDSGALQRVAD